MALPGAEEQREEAVLILAPTAKDTRLSRAVFGQAGIDCAVCTDLDDLCARIERGAGAAMLSEEALVGPGLGRLSGVLDRQPAWSDLPLIVLVQEGANSRLALRALETLGNVTLLERPVRVPTLVSSLRAALRARRRQYQIRDYLAESLRIAASLREADRRKDEFLAILAHELRNPLAPLRSASHALSRAGDDRDLRTWASGVIGRQVGQMARLIDELLDVSRLSRGHITLRQEDLVLNDLVEEALEACRSAIEQAGHHVRVSLPQDAVVVRGDATRLVQVICNLLNNAAKYTPPGGLIELSARRGEGNVELAVRDNGVGIPPGMLERVFDMFTQLDRSLERAQGGLGIGLTIVKRLVELHGGAVEARSPGAGQGSEFIVRLPVKVAPASERGAPLPAAVSTRDGRKHRILIADDNRDAADSLALMLRMEGHEVRTAYDGEQALELTQAFHPKIALLDIGMPRMSGHDVARRIRSSPSGEKVLLIALTGWGQKEDRERSLRAGFDHHLVKPITASALDELLLRVPS